MTTTSQFLKKTVTVRDRQFIIQILKLDNGDFISVTEGNENLGSLVISLATGPKPVTTTVIPSKTESLFLKLTAEKVSTTIHGIAIVSLNVQSKIDTEAAKVIMSEISGMIQNV